MVHRRSGGPYQLKREVRAVQVAQHQREVPAEALSNGVKIGHLNRSLCANLCILLLCLRVCRSTDVLGAENAGGEVSGVNSNNVVQEVVHELLLVPAWDDANRERQQVVGL